MELKEITEFLDKEFKVDQEFLDDYTRNGLQVQSTKDIKKIAFAVDGCLDTFKEAIKNNCDLLIVHHGIMFGKWETITGVNYARAKYLIENNLALYNLHLPLDKHETLGNNAQLLKLLKAKIIEPFDVGYIAEIKETDIKEIQKKLDNQLSAKSTLLNFGKDKIKTIAVISGSACRNTIKAIEKNADLYITGESSHDVYHTAKDGNFNVVFLGHYESETLGIKALMEHIKEKLKLECIYIDAPVPTGK